MTCAVKQEKQNMSQEQIYPVEFLDYAIIHFIEKIIGRIQDLPR